MKCENAACTSGQPAAVTFSGRMLVGSVVQPVTLKVCAKCANSAFMGQAPISMEASVKMRT